MPSLRMSLGINSPIFFLNKASQKALRLYKKLKCLPTHHASICASGQVQAPGPTPVLVYDPQCGPLFFQYFQQVKEKQLAMAKPFQALLLQDYIIAIITAHLGPHMWPSPGPGPDSKCSKRVEFMLRVNTCKACESKIATMPLMKSKEKNQKSVSV